MSFELEVNQEQQFVHLRYGGRVVIEERFEARKQVFSLVKEQGFHRTLVETQDSDIVMDMNDIIKFANSFKELEKPEGYHVACVIAPGDEAGTLLEYMASSDGLSIKVFLSRKDALDWLLAF
jgi:hypothetical protein